MSGDPVEEGGQQVRQGFVQALQTAHTTAALMRGRGTEGRSATEHRQRVQQAEQRELRSIREHNVRVGVAIDKARTDWKIGQARVDEIKGRTSHNKDAHELGETETRARMGRADRDLARRDKAGEQEHTHNQEIHDRKTKAYDRREERADEVHGLDVEYKRLLIDIRRRAAGFTDTLTNQGSEGQAEASTAAFAAADANRDLSDEHDADADAFAQRFAEDTGHEFTDDGVFTAAALPATADDAVIDVEFFDIDPDTPEATGSDGPATDPGEPIEPEYPGSSSSSADAVTGLTEELTAETRLSHVAEPFMDSELAPDRGVGALVADAVDAAVGGDIGDGPQPGDEAGIDPSAEWFGPDPEWDQRFGPEPERGL
ncbi:MULTISPECIES: hypothetical protein [Nocardia]|uniref:hypothetical protein n=1 Tax=Nocardia TaxID=1817 RepID=UPI0002D9E6C0|nr:MULTISPECIES: hypothetical protein [Nocardia]